MRRRVLSAILASIPLLFAACGKPDFDIPLSDEKSSILDTRLIGIWQVVAPKGSGLHGCLFVGIKQGRSNSLKLSMVDVGDDFTISSRRLDLFACHGEHNYLSIISDPPDKSAFLPQWMLARYDFAVDGSIHVRPVKYDVFRALVRRKIFRGRLKGTIEGRRRRDDWVFSMPGREVERLHFADSSEALIKLLDAHSEECFEPTAIVCKRMGIGGKFDGQPPKDSQVSADAAIPAARAVKSTSKETTHDDGTSELPQSFKVVVTLQRPGEYEAGRLEAFRSVALRAPWVYVLDRTGTLCVFHLDHKRAASPREIISPRASNAVPPANILEHAGDGDDLKIFGNVLVCTESGGLEAYNLDVPDKPRPIGRFGPRQKRWQGTSLVRHGNVAFVVGDRMIQSYDLTRPDHPLHLGTLETKQFTSGGCAAGHFLYLTVTGKQGHGISTINVSNPAHPVEVSFAPTSQPAFALFATPDRRLIASLDSDGGWQMASESYITVYGHSALFGLADPEHPRLLKAYKQSGGRTSAFSCIDGRCFFVCHGVVFAVTKDGLEPDSVFFPDGSTLDGLPYHGDADGKYAALAADSSVIVLRRSRVK